MLRMDESEGAVEVLAPESLSGLSPRGLNATALQWATEEGRETERRPSGRSVDVSEGSGRAGRRGARPRESHAGRQGSLSKVCVCVWGGRWWRRTRPNTVCRDKGQRAVHWKKKR